MVKRGEDLNTQKIATERGLDCELFSRKKLLLSGVNGLFLQKIMFLCTDLYSLVFLCELFPKRKNTKIGFLCFLGFLKNRLNNLSNIEG